MPREVYDVAVIGGGIHGAGVAQAAAARGWSVLVLEQTGLASGTSSRSSKLIHGGLRYLEGGHLNLVRECLRERALLLKLAPELVRLRPFHIPLYTNTTRRPWQIFAGLSIYAALSGADKSSTFCRVPRREWAELDGLTTDGLTAVYQYWDAQTDDALLTRAVMHSACELGAELLLPATVLNATLHADRVSLVYQHHGHTLGAEARVLVNAAGPWVNNVLKAMTPRVSALPVDLVQGTHIVVPGVLQSGIYYVEAPQDRRAVFVMPWHDQVLVGTTETVYRGDPGLVQPLATERAYLRETLGHYFPHLAHAPISEEFAGLRVLPALSGNAFGRPRETTLHPDRTQRPRVLTIYGGKLTAYRATAQQVVTQIAASLPEHAIQARTDEVPLTPAPEGFARLEIYH